MLACINASVIFFQKRIVNYRKTKKADMKIILSPLIVEYYEKSEAPTDVAAAMSASAEDTVTFASGIECGMGEDAEGLLAQDV